MRDQEREQSDDVTLLRAAAAGDKRAFSTLVQRHQAAVYRYALALTRERAQAEDALQEAFVGAWHGAAGFRGETSVRAWLLVLARHAVAKQLRRHAGEPARLANVDSLEEIGALGQAAGYGDIRAQEQIVARLADRERLQTVLGRLDAGDRDLIWSVDGLGLTNEEAAAALGIGLAAEKSRLHRARLRLMALLREED